MAYENLCMYCFEDMEGQTTCPHCGRDSRAAVPQIQMLPGSQVYHNRFLIGRALGQDATGIVYAAYDTKKENRLRIREYLPRDCAERLNDGTVVPSAGKEDEYDAGHIPDAILIPNESIGEERPDALPDLEQIILIYCRSGNRSKQAAQKLFDMGYTNVYEFGGVVDWTGELVKETE